MNNRRLKLVKNKYSYYTIGHSNRPINDFIEILKNENINFVIDVRSLPGSNKNPQYNSETLIKKLKLHKIKYKHIPKLGGLRKNNKKVLPSINSFWIKKSFHNYADYAMSDNSFKEGLEELIKFGEENCCVVMCAEVLWWRCHRRIITDYLLSANKKVYHIIDSNNIKKAFMTKGAKITKLKSIKYPKNKIE